MKKILILLFASIALQSYAQDEVIAQSLEDSSFSIGTDFGGFSSGRNDKSRSLIELRGAPLSSNAPGYKSTGFGVTLNTSFCLPYGGFNAFMIEYGLVTNAYRFNKGSQFIVPDPNFKTQTLTTTQLQFKLGNRFLFQPEREVRSAFLEIGGYFGCLRGGFLNMTYTYNDTTYGGARKGQVRLNKLKYVNNIEYGLYSKFGKNHFYAMAEYRLSTFFKKGYVGNDGKEYAELSPLVFGLGFSF